MTCSITPLLPLEGHVLGSTLSMFAEKSGGCTVLRSLPLQVAPPRLSKGACWDIIIRFSELYHNLIFHYSPVGRNFEPQLFSEVCRLLSTLTTPYHPQSDGLMERLNRTFLTIHSIKANEDQENWDVCLPEIMMAYRTSVSEMTGFTAFQLMFGREIRLPLDLS